MSQDPVLPGYYFYFPLTEGGKYESSLEDIFSYAAGKVEMAIALKDGSFDPSQAGYPDGPIERAAGFIGAGIGYFIDNASTIASNIAAALSDPQFWNPPEPED